MTTVDAVRWLIALARPERGRLISAVLLGAAAAGASVALMGTAAYLIARASQQPPVMTLTVVIVGVRFFGVSRAVARYAERLVGHDAAFRVVSDLRVSVYRRVEPLVPARLGGRSSTDVLTRFAVDVETISDAYLRVFPPFAIAAVVGIVTVTILAFIDPWVGVVLATGLLVNALLVPRLVQRTVERAQRSLADRRSSHAEQLVELLEALPETWVADTSGPMVRRVNDQREGLLERELKVSRGAGLGLALGSLVAGLTVVTCVVLGTAAVDSGAVDGVLLAVLVLTPLAAFDLTATLPDAVSRWARVRAALERIHELEGAGHERPTGSAELPPTSGGGPEVALEGGTVRWPGAERPSLTDVSLVIPTGSRVAIVGPSGSGKSTLAMTLAGFLAVEDGRLTCRGVAHTQLDEAALHAFVGLLEQRPYVFDTSVAENLLLASPEAGYERLREVLTRVGLGPWTEGLPRGLDTPVGEHGRRLSGGQRQRLGLARLLLSGHPVVVLDEPDEHLDALSADALMADLLAAAHDRTTVVISHRLAPLVGVDHTIVLDGGRVIEEGSHGELMARGGWYARAWMREQEVGCLTTAAP
jgi:ATP-binding cassette subfamily C protein CydCD